MKKIDEQELKNIQIGILDYIDSYCRKNGIDYYLQAGTLLGAVRHKGYIPWDDDIDVSMKRDDYERFFESFNKHADGPYKAIYYKNDPGYYMQFGKVVDTRTVMKEETNFKKEIGVYVDVFPFDYLPSDIKSIKKLNNRIKPYRKALDIKTISPSPKRVWYKNLILRIGSFVLKPISCYWLIDRINSLARKYNEGNDKTNIAGIAVLNYGLKEVHDSHCFNGHVELEFEGKKYNCPIGYKNVLKNTYGDYMKLPPVELRKSHHVYKAWWI